MKRLFRNLKSGFILRGATVLAQVEPHRRPRLCLDGQQRMGRRVALFCHFDRKGRIAPYARQYLENIAASGYSVVFISNSGRRKPDDLAWITANSARVIVRPNVGYDFSAWRDGLRHGGFDLAELESLLILNDSVYGPFSDLGDLLKRIDYGEADMWGCTDSWQIRYHLQSYFLAFGPEALKRKAFKDFWRRVRPIRSKVKIIETYEVGLTQKLLESGLRCKAIWPYTGLLDIITTTVDARERRDDHVHYMEFLHSVLRNGATRDRRASAQPYMDLIHALSRQTRLRDGQAGDGDGPAAAAALTLADTAFRSQDLISLDYALHRMPMNPVCDLWRLLLEQGFPFLKRELLRDNPTRTVDIALWRHAASHIPELHHAHIIGDLSRALTNRAP